MMTLFDQEKAMEQFMKQFGYEKKQEGLAEGMEKGLEKGKKQTAFNMKKKGYSDTTIAELLEVSVNVVQQWLSGSNIAKP